MFALIRFSDNSYFISKSSDLRKRHVKGNEVYSVKYSDGKRYEANIIVYDDSTLLLEKMKTHLEANLKEISVKDNLYESMNNENHLQNEAFIDINSSEPRASLDEALNWTDLAIEESLETPHVTSKDNIYNSTPLESSVNLEFSGGTDIIPPTIGSNDDYHPLSNASLLAGNDESSRSKDLSKKSSSANESNVSNGLQISLIENVESVPDDTKLKVENSSQRTKRYFCFYCKKPQTKFARHLASMHSEEEEVKSFLRLPVKDVERKNMIGKLRKKGIHEFNTNNQYNTGELMVCRRPNKKIKKSATDFTVCACCKGYYAKSVFRHHFRKCSKRTSDHGRIGMVKGRQAAGRVHQKASIAVKNHIIPYMQEDNIFYAIRFDELLILFANKECNRYGIHQHQYQMVRSHLRYLGRFFLAIKEINKDITDFSSIYQPKFYDDCILAVKHVAGFNENTNSYDTPSVATSLGTLLKKVADVHRSCCIKNGNDKELKLVQDFIHLQHEDFGTSVNKVALESQQKQKRQKKVILPSTKDILKLYNHLKHERRSAFKNLKKKFSYNEWRALAGTTLTTIQLFNRRRAGEIERILIDDFNTYSGIATDINNDTYKSLSIESQNVAKEYVRFVIRGKIGRNVPVLLSCELLQCAKLIETYRKKANVPPTNPYLFGVHSNDGNRPKYLSACKLLRQFAEGSGAVLPTALRGTELRKHIATKCIHFDLSENEVADLANFMGHAEKIHKEYYRQPVVERDILKISQILEIGLGAEKNTKENNSFNRSNDAVCGKRSNNTHSKSTSNVNELVPTKSARIENDDIMEEENEEEEEEAESRRRSNFGIRRRWGQKEKQIVLAAFEKYMKSSKFPSPTETLEVIRKNKCLKDRTPCQIVSFLQYQKKRNAEPSKRTYKGQ